MLRPFRWEAAARANTLADRKAAAPKREAAQVDGAADRSRTIRLTLRSGALKRDDMSRPLPVDRPEKLRSRMDRCAERR
jgi:hypothetical protein